MRRLENEGEGEGGWIHTGNPTIRAWQVVPAAMSRSTKPTGVTSVTAASLDIPHPSVSRVGQALRGPTCEEDHHFRVGVKPLYSRPK